MIAWRPETMSILPFALVCGCGGTSRNYSRSGDDLFRFLFRSGEPAKVIFSLKHLSKRVARLSAERFKKLRWKLAHVLKHPGAMPTDQLEIGNGGEANLKSVRHRTSVSTKRTRRRS